MEGDITARIKIEMSPIRAATIYLQYGRPAARRIPEHRVPVDAATAQRIIDEAGLNVKTFGD
jgi:hypothetical protein